MLGKNLSYYVFIASCAVACWYKKVENLMRMIKIGMTEPCPGLHDSRRVGKATNGSETNCCHFQINAILLLSVTTFGV